jgi:hypothetical protein
MTAELEGSARLDAVAAVRAILDNKPDDLAVLLQGTGEPREAFHAAAGFAASLLGLMSPQAREDILYRLTQAAVNE